MCCMRASRPAVFQSACSVAARGECRSHLAQYGFQRNAGLGGCGFERFVTSPAEIETILFKNSNRCRLVPQRFAASVWNLNRSLGSVRSNQDSTRQPKFRNHDVCIPDCDKRLLAESPNRWTVESCGRDHSMTAVERLAEFAVSAPYEELSETARQQLKIRILDALGCAIGAMDAKPLQMIRKNIAEFDANGKMHTAGRRTGKSGTCGISQWSRCSLPGLQRQLPGKGRNLPSQRQSGTHSGGGGVCGLERPGLDDGPRSRLPGAVPIERCRRRPRRGVRSHRTGSLCRCCGSRARIGSRCHQVRQRHRHQWHRPEWAPRDADWKAFALEGSCLSPYGRLAPLPSSFWPARELRVRWKSLRARRG